jgi:outer membrane protein insertion porin family
MMVLLQLWQSSELLASSRNDSSLTVAKIVVVGNESTKEYVILREMSLKVGGTLDTVAMQYDQKRIYSLQLFNKVDIDYTAEGTQATVFVRVSERWYIFPIPILGFKYRDLSKPFYGAALIHQNFRGRNEKVMASAIFGYDGSFTLSYQNPKLTDDDDIFFGGAIGMHHVRNLNVAQNEYDQKVFAAGFSLGKRFGLYLTLLGSVGYDQWEIADPQADRTLSPDGRDRFFSIGGNLSYDRRDIREYPMAGSYFGIAATKFGLGESEVNLVRYRIDLRDYEPLNGDFSLCVRAFGSFLSGGASPSYLHSFFGYNDRIRGYFKEALEGEDLTGGSLELRLAIFKPRYLTVSIPYLPREFSVWRYGLYAGIFADAGTTWFRNDAVLKGPWYAGYGVGLHFLLPYSFVVRTEYALNQHGRSEFVLDFDASF